MILLYPRPGAAVSTPQPTTGTCYQVPAHDDLAALAEPARNSAASVQAEEHQACNNREMQGSASGDRPRGGVAEANP
jgi:hypothetical protein